MHRWLIAVIGVLMLAGCSSKFGYVEKTVVGGDVQMGHDAILRYGCGACHHIPGVAGADTFVGPPLNRFAQRHFIAGNLPNTADNLIYWIQFPQLVEPGTAMPDLNVSETDARNIAAYLYSR
jgi:cytochrome c1